MTADEVKGDGISVEEGRQESSSVRVRPTYCLVIADANRSATVSADVDQFDQYAIGIDHGGHAGRSGEPVNLNLCSR